MFLQPGSRLADFKSSVRDFDHGVVENHSIQKTFNVIYGFLGQWRAQLVREAAAVHRQDFDEMDLVG